MITVKILIDTIDKVKNFNAVLNKEDGDFDIVGGGYIIDARSIMGIFSIDISKPLQLNIHSDDTQTVERLKDYIVEE